MASTGRSRRPRAEAVRRGRDEEAKRVDARDEAEEEEEEGAVAEVSIWFGIQIGRGSRSSFFSVAVADRSRGVSGWQTGHVVVSQVETGGVENRRRRLDLLHVIVSTMVLQ